MSERRFADLERRVAELEAILTPPMALPKRVVLVPPSQPREWATAHPYAKSPMGLRDGVFRGFATPEEARAWVFGEDAP